MSIYPICGLCDDECEAEPPFGDGCLCDDQPGSCLFCIDGCTGGD